MIIKNNNNGQTSRKALILFFLSPSQEKQQRELGQSLITEVSLESLKQADLTIDIGNNLIIKESVIRRNDSLFSILKNMGAKTENIIDLINYYLI